MKSKIFCTIVFCMFSLSVYANDSAYANDFCQTAENELNRAFTNYQQSADTDDDYDKALETLQNLAVKTLSNPQSTQCAWANLSEFNIQQSPDKRLLSLDWRVDGGGTMQVFDGVLQYHSGNKVVAVPEEFGYALQIHQMTLGGRTIYLVTGWGAGYSSLHGQSLTLYEIVNNKPAPANLIKTKEGLVNSIDFAYNPFLIDDDTNLNELIKVSPDQQEFSIPVIIENDDYPNGKVTKNSLRYRYNGKHFVYVK